MLYHLIKFYARLTLPLWCGRLVINKPGVLQIRGPVLFAANHPNSFLDGMVLTTLLHEDLYSLARGDAFRQRKWDRFLRWLRLLPVYRTSEGVENLEHNYTTFDTCLDLFREGGNVIIFSEGRCINEWHLRPLRKGTARLATAAWDARIPLTVIPTAFNYSRWRGWGRSIHLQFGEPIAMEPVMAAEGGRRLILFNQQLQAQLQSLVYEIPKGDTAAHRRHFGAGMSLTKKALLAVPAAVGAALHLPLYLGAKAAADRWFDNDHYNSVLISLMQLAYPFYLAIFCAIAAGMGGGVAVMVTLVFLPLSAWAAAQWWSAK